VLFGFESLTCHTKKGPAQAGPFFVCRVIGAPPWAPAEQSSALRSNVDAAQWESNPFFASRGGWSVGPPDPAGHAKPPTLNP